MVAVPVVAEQQEKREKTVDEQPDDPADPQSLHAPVPDIAEVVAQRQR